jgi:hypothetical protein
MGTLYPGKDPPPPASTQAGSVKIVGGETGDGPGPYVLGCDALLGEPVLDAHGEKVGVLAHLMLDVQRGRIAYAVVGCGGVLGLGEKLHAVPWSAFTLDADRRCLTLALDREALEQAPEFDRSRWPEAAGTTWQAVDRYYENRT